MTLYLNAYFALEAPRTIFWSPTEERSAVCSKNRDHPLPAKAKFCSECATPIQLEAAEQASPVLAAFAAELGVIPEVAFAELVDPDGGWFWTADNGTQFALTIRWLSIERMAGQEPVKGLGFKIGRELYLEREAKQLAYSLTDLAPYHIALLEVAKKFGITTEPRLWLQVEASKFDHWNP